MDPQADGRLRWRCRRGMKELDVLLSRWLERRWSQSDPARRRDFERLLEQPDPVLVDWLIGGGRPESPDFARLVDDIVRPRT